MFCDSQSIPAYTESLDAVLGLYGGATGIVPPERVPSDPRAALAEVLRARLPGMLAWIANGRPVS